jgi:hypothetical protein
MNAMRLQLTGPGDCFHATPMSLGLRHARRLFGLHGHACVKSQTCAASSHRAAQPSLQKVVTSALSELIALSICIVAASPLAPGCTLRMAVSRVFCLWDSKRLCFHCWACTTNERRRHACEFQIGQSAHTTSMQLSTQVFSPPSSSSSCLTGRVILCFVCIDDATWLPTSHGIFVTEGLACICTLDQCFGNRFPPTVFTTWRGISLAHICWARTLHHVFREFPKFWTQEDVTQKQSFV